MKLNKRLSSVNTARNKNFLQKTSTFPKNFPLTRKLEFSFIAKYINLPDIFKVNDAEAKKLLVFDILFPRKLIKPF